MTREELAKEPEMTERELVLFRPVWLGLLVAVSAAITVVFTCVTPFAAFAVIAAATVSRRDAVMLAVALWLTNQAVGFGFLHYPWTAAALAWGLALGAGAVVGALAALEIFRRLGSLRPLARNVCAFGAAFVLYQLTLLAAAVAWLGGTDMFAPRIVSQVLMINAVTLAGLFALRQVVTGAALLIRRRRAQASPARLA
jgi:hypothetical protein